jgi:hypothetical protein
VGPWEREAEESHTGKLLREVGGEPSIGLDSIPLVEQARSQRTGDVK